LKAGKLYKRFRARNGRTVTLRALKWEDLDDLVVFINKLVEERGTNSDLGIVADKRQTKEDEAEWLSRQLTGIETGNVISVAAEVGGRVVANSEVTRGAYSDTSRHGYLGIAALKEYRGLGIGFEMMKTLVRESRKTGLKTVQLEVFGNNAQAIHVYEKTGFRRVGRVPKKIRRGRRFIDAVLMATEL